MTYCSVVAVLLLVSLTKETLWPLCYIENFIPQITKFNLELEPSTLLIMHY